MLKADSYTSKGTKEKTKVSLPESFQENENMPLLAQAIHVYRDRMHNGFSKTKTRGEISLTTKKWYRQKGTGRARHGAQSAPIFVGGSKAHGPKGVKRTLSLSKKLRQKALAVALTLKVKEDEVIFVDGISSWKKTKEAQNFINRIIKEKKFKDNARFTFALGEENKDSVKVLRNLANVNVTYFSELNAYDVFYGGILVVDKNSIDNKENKKEKKT